MLPACLPFLDIFSDVVFHGPFLPVEPITWMETFVAVSTEYLVQFYGNRIPCLTHYLIITKRTKRITGKLLKDPIITVVQHIKEKSNKSLTIRPFIFQ